MSLHISLIVQVHTLSPWIHKLLCFCLYIYIYLVPNIYIYLSMYTNNLHDDVFLHNSMLTMYMDIYIYTHYAFCMPMIIIMMIIMTIMIIMIMIVQGRFLMNDDWWLMIVDGLCLMISDDYLWLMINDWCLIIDLWPLIIDHWSLNMRIIMIFVIMIYIYICIL